MQAMLQAVLFFASALFVIGGLGMKGAGEFQGDPIQIAIGYAAVGIGIVFALLGISRPTNNRRDSN